MLRLLLAGGVVAGGLWWHHKHRSPLHAALTPERAAIHGHLMGNEYRPDKLEHMANLFGQEGLPQQAKELASKASEIRKQADGAAALIDRARTGDQNAMGMIAAVREQAQAGSPRAQVSCALMARYCAAKPMPELGPLGETPVAA
jgi:hypothetical protein